MSRAPLLALDFDGVLSPGISGTLCYMDVLCRWLRDHPSVEVVITSNWREQESLAELWRYFPPDIKPRIKGATPVLGGKAARYAEIQAWRFETGHQGPWCALDDREELFPKDCPFLVLVNGAYGLRAQHLAQVELVLNLR